MRESDGPRAALMNALEMTRQAIVLERERRLCGGQRRPARGSLRLLPCAAALSRRPYSIIGASKVVHQCLVSCRSALSPSR